MIILLAWIIDLLWGEPPAAIHPVVWMGNYLAWSQLHVPATFLAGILSWWGGAMWVTGLGILVQVGIDRLSHWLFPFSPVASMVEILLSALVLKPMFAWTALRQAVERVGTASDLDTARFRLEESLVSRPTADLSASEVYGAAIESLTENLSDSVVAPLCYYLIGGIPAAALYRYANTADAMWGYRTPELEWFGKWAARVDDGLNWIPARLTAFLLYVCSGLLGLDIQGSWRTWQRDGGKTTSPNAGQPMSAASGALGIHLSKRGVYDLGAELRDPEQIDVNRALRLAHVSAWIVVLCIAGVQLLTSRLL